MDIKPPNTDPLQVIGRLYIELLNNQQTINQLTNALYAAEAQISQLTELAQRKNHVGHSSSETTNN
jgi:hypothetical protein